MVPAGASSETSHHRIVPQRSVSAAARPVALTDHLRCTKGAFLSVLIFDWTLPTEGALFLIGDRAPRLVGGKHARIQTNYSNDDRVPAVPQVWRANVTRHHFH
jgi:hypothetical protein